MRLVGSIVGICDALRLCTIQKGNNMATLNFNEKQILEKYLEMKDGFVLDFYNSSFHDFFQSTFNINIYLDKYNESGDSKAKRMRTFWKKESNNLVAEVLHELYKYKNEENVQVEEIIYKLKNIKEKINLNILDELIDDSDFNKIVHLIENEFNSNGEYSSILDRLHTLIVKFIRHLCKKHNLTFKDGQSLDSLYGHYKNHLVNNKLIQSDNSLLILKSSVKMIESLNNTRNSESLAHDNKLLNENESKFIVNSVVNVITFISEIEKEFDDLNKENDDDIPF